MGVSHFSKSSEQRHQQICILDSLSQDACVIKSLTRYSVFLQSRGQICLLSRIVMKLVSPQGRFSSSPLIKDLCFQGSEFLTSCSGITWPSLHHCGNWALGTSAVDTLATAIVGLCPLPLSQESTYFI